MVPLLFQIQRSGCPSTHGCIILRMQPFTKVRRRTLVTAPTGGELMVGKSKERGSRTHLTPVVYHTLLELWDGSLHGYAISQAVERLTDGRIRMGPGTLYGTLKRLQDERWIEPTEAVAAEGVHAARRRYYALTTTGRSALEGEAQRLERAVGLARKHAVIGR